MKQDLLRKSYPCSLFFVVNNRHLGHKSSVAQLLNLHIIVALKLCQYQSKHLLPFNYPNSKCTGGCIDLISSSTFCWSSIADENNCGPLRVTPPSIAVPENLDKF